MPDAATELVTIGQAFEAAGGDAGVWADRSVASAVVSHRRILHTNNIPGVRIEGVSTETGVKVQVTVEPGAQIDKPVHLCFGVLPREGLQEIVSRFHIGQGAKVRFLAHCTFPNAVRVRHLMQADIYVGKGAEMEYSETHFHGPEGGVEVVPVARIQVDEGGVYKSTFKLVEGPVGILNIDYQAHLAKDAVCELDAKVYGKKQDRITINESLYLDGENARGLARSRVVASEQCVSLVVGEAVGNAPEARGHVDCVEILQGPQARASAVPKLQVNDPRAKLTHEAAIGSVDKRQVETLMARGLTEEEAVDVVVKGMLR